MSVERWCEERERLIREATGLPWHQVDDEIEEDAQLITSAVNDQPAVVELVRAAMGLLATRDECYDLDSGTIQEGRWVVDDSKTIALGAALAKLTGESDE